MMHLIWMHPVPPVNVTWFNTNGYLKGTFSMPEKCYCDRRQDRNYGSRRKLSGFIQQKQQRKAIYFSGSQGQFEKRTLYAYDRTAHKFFKVMRWNF